jgi:hypothetical protein
MQSKRYSVYEAIANNIVAFVISIVIGKFIYPLYGFKPSLADNASLVAVFTIASFIRSYFLRRLFNKADS